MRIIIVDGTVYASRVSWILTASFIDITEKKGLPMVRIPGP